MPNFQLDRGSPEAARQFQALDSFTQGYIEAMFFTCTGTGDDAEGDLEHATVAELAPSALQRIIADCQAFRDSLPKDGHGRTWLDLAFDYAPAGYDEQRAGNDYWYSRNGHGTGYWDRGLGEIGDKLHAAAGFSQVDLYRGDDGLIYLS